MGLALDELRAAGMRIDPDDVERLSPWYTTTSHVDGREQASHSALLIDARRNCVLVATVAKLSGRGYSWRHGLQCDVIAESIQSFDEPAGNLFAVVFVKVVAAQVGLGRHEARVSASPRAPEQKALIETGLTTQLEIDSLTAAVDAGLEHDVHCSTSGIMVTMIAELPG